MSESGFPVERGLGGGRGVAVVLEGVWIGRESHLRPIEVGMCRSVADETADLVLVSVYRHVRLADDCA